MYLPLILAATFTVIFGKRDLLAMAAGASSCDACCVSENAAKPND